MTINVTSVNDAPADTGSTSWPRSFFFSEPNRTPAHSLFPYTTLFRSSAGSGTLTDTGVAVTAGQFVSVADINAGKLVFTPAANANGSPEASFTFQGQDEHSTAND